MCVCLALPYSFFPRMYFLGGTVLGSWSDLGLLQVRESTVGGGGGSFGHPRAEASTWVCGFQVSALDLGGGGGGRAMPFPELSDLLNYRKVRKKVVHASDKPHSSFRLFV